MHVDLTIRGEQLLRDALAFDPAHSPAEIVEQALSEHLQRKAVTTPPENLRSRAGLEAALDRLAAHSDKIPLLPDDSFSREAIYQDHD